MPQDRSRRDLTESATYDICAVAARLGQQSDEGHVPLAFILDDVDGEWIILLEIKSPFCQL